MAVESFWAATRARLFVAAAEIMDQNLRPMGPPAVKSRVGPLPEMSIAKWMAKDSTILKTYTGSK